jgi:hypothetical protein
MLFFVTVALLAGDLIYMVKFATFTRNAFFWLAIIAFLECLVFICVIIWNKEISENTTPYEPF